MDEHEFKTVQIRNKAHELGFDLFGTAPAGILKENEAFLRSWCSSGMNADMAYLQRDIEKRINPELLLPGARSVIVTGLNYYTGKKQGGNGIPVVSRYAYGTNYHDVIKDKLEMLSEFMHQLDRNCHSMAFVDSAPVLEKAWGARAGLGWQGRHSLLINKNIGSFFFLGIIITDTRLDYDKPSADHCGTCRLCVEACPAAAINDNRTIDARRCIAYLTIEGKAPVSEDVADSLEGRIFGCDICQEACPWNSAAKPHNTPEFDIIPELEQMTASDWQSLTMEKFKKLFNRSAVGRRKYDTFMKNVISVLNSSRI